MNGLMNKDRHTHGRDINLHIGIRRSKRMRRVIVKCSYSVRRTAGAARQPAYRIR